MSVSIKIRSRLSSVGDSSSAPPSESSDEGVDWNQPTHQTNIIVNDSLYTASSDSDMHSLSPDNGGALTEMERAQVESFFSGLGTEVSKFHLFINRKQIQSF